MAERISQKYQKAMRVFNKHGRKCKEQASRESLLLALPTELRLQIWQYVFEGITAAHFHVFDTVYDSCLYAEPPKLSKTTSRCNVLVLNQFIHAEAIDILYKNVRFTLDLLAGEPRSLRSQLKYHCVGSLAQCAPLFRRMETVLLQIRPGVRPHGQRFATRIAKFLEAMGHGKHAKWLTLRVILHKDFEVTESIHTIFAAIEPLASRRFAAGPVGENGETFSVAVQPKTLRKLIHAVLQPNDPNTSRLFVLNQKENWQPKGDIRIEPTPCLTRAILGQQAPHRPLTRVERNVCRATVVAAVLVAPISLAAGVALWARRKQIKGGVVSWAEFKHDLVN